MPRSAFPLLRFNHALPFSVMLVLGACSGSSDGGSGTDTSGNSGSTTGGSSSSATGSSATTNGTGTASGATSGSTTSASDSAGTGAATATDTGDDRTPGADETVVVFDKEYIYFGDPNHQVALSEVIFPDASFTYSDITGHFALSCPNGLCDHWDRYATFGILLDEGTPDEVYVELDRFITAYRVGFNWESDLSHLRPVLTGAQTMRVYIETWVSQGHEAGDGWLFDASIDFVGGPAPSPEPIAVIPIWPHGNYKSGLPDNTPVDQMPPVMVDVPPADFFMLRSFISGHGWNNAQNCAEFCSKDHSYDVDGEVFTRAVWRDDCGQTVTDGPQQGTWTYSRAGWCPGARVRPWDMDVTGALAGKTSATIGYDLEPFVWAGDGDQPNYYMSGNLVAWRE